MKGLSLWEPWGTAIARHLKAIETRGWATSYRGPLAIHCAQTKVGVSFISDPMVNDYFIAAGVMSERDLSFGCIVAVAMLSDVVPAEKLLEGHLVSDQEKAFGSYDAGRFGWLLKSVMPLKTPLPWRGSQGLFDVPDSALKGLLE